MNISKQEIDALNAVVTIVVEKDDYREKVDKILKDYRKKANVPGFRQGHVPMGLIKKQYETPVIIDEVNKLLQEELNKFLLEEKLDILGNPLPKENENFTWDSDTFEFDFELGLAPVFDINFDDKTPLVYLDVDIDEDFIDQEVDNIRKQYGKMIAEDEVSEHSTVVGDFKFEYKGEAQEKGATFDLSQIKGKTNAKKFIGKKADDTIKLKTKNLFKDDHDLMHALGLDHDDAHNFEADVEFTLKEINFREPAELNQEFYDKIFGEGKVKEEEEMKAKIKEGAELQFQNQSDQKFLNDATDYLIEKYNFDLPSAFLQRWLKVSGENPMTDEEAKAEYERSEKGLRYQLIEGKIAKEHNLTVNMDELREHTKNLLKAQYAQYGQADLMKDEFLDGVINNIMQNQDEVRRLSEQVMSKKLLDLYKDKLQYETKKLPYKDFVEETYK